MYPTPQTAPQAQMLQSRPYPDAVIAGIAGSAAPSESELQYASRVASESLAVLEKSVHALAARLTIVLEQSPPQPATQEGKPVRTLSSQIANALIAHANQTDNVTGVVQDLLRRLAL